MNFAYCIYYSSIIICLSFIKNILFVMNKKLWYKEYKSKLSCIYCGFKHPAAIDLHHRDFKNKSGNVSELLWRRGLSFVKKEIEKCDPVCSNCHRKITFGVGVKECHLKTKKIKKHIKKNII